MATDLTYRYAADITKAERDENGDLLVYGKATGSDRDLDGQRCRSSWLKTAMPKWGMWSNLREMHQPIAAGIGIELTNDGDDWFVKSKVIDPGTARKIEAGVLKGYSIGIKSPVIEKSNGEEWITGGDICEISYVDRPCLESAKTMICKMVGGNTLEPVEAAEAEVRLIPTPKDLAERLSKAASSISSAQDLAARLGKAADTATSDEDSPEPAVDPATNVATTHIPTVTTSSGTNVLYTTTTGNTTTGTFDLHTKGSSIETRDAITKALIDELRSRTVSSEVGKGAMPPIEPGGKPRYPITDVASLKNAIQAFGRAKDSDKAKVKAHIKSEAARLGASSLIPDNWKAVLVKDAAALNGMDDSDGWRHDPTQLRTVLSGLVDCMKAELDELVAGDNELWDLTQLLSSISGFCSWWSSEAAGGETESPYTEGGTMTELAATPDATKTVEVTVDDVKKAKDDLERELTKPDAEKAAEATKAVETAPEAPESTDSAQDLTELVKSAVAEAMKTLTPAAEERNTALATELEVVKAELAKVLALPESGGPVITRTAAQAAVARENDNLEMHKAITELLQKADAASDPTLRRGYKERAEAIKMKIA